MIERGQFNRENMDLFWRFVAERQSIWDRRFVQRLPAPWTKDPILQRNKFTNIYRELDPGTHYSLTIMERDEPRPDRIFNVMLYRLMCSIPTYSEIGFQRLNDFRWKDLQASLKQIYDRGQPVFGNAYLISPYSSMGSDLKYVNVARLFGQLHHNFWTFFTNLDKAPTLEKAFKVVNTEYGFGPFLAYQVCVDLMYPLHGDKGNSLLRFSHDDWAKLGPGAIRGFGRLTKGKPYVDSLAGLRWLRENQREEFYRVGVGFPFLIDANGEEIEISLANLQNCLCEFHKYGSLLEGTGKAQRLFVPSNSTGL